MFLTIENKTNISQNTPDTLCLSLEKGEICAILTDSSFGEMTVDRCITPVFPSSTLRSNISVLEHIQAEADICPHPLDIQELMTTLNIVPLSNQLPANLSISQQRIISLAMAMVKNPAFLFFSQPTDTLDSDSAKAVLTAIEKLNQKYKTTIIIATHNDRILAMADQILWLKDGKIIRALPNTRKIAVMDLPV